MEKLHVTIQSETPIKLERCMTCCSKFHCPFCKPEVFKPTVESKVRNHITAHEKRAVHFKGYIIFKCNLSCSPYAHFHCPNCVKLLDKKNRYLEHLTKCLCEKEVGHFGPRGEDSIIQSKLANRLELHNPYPCDEESQMEVQHLNENCTNKEQCCHADTAEMVGQSGPREDGGQNNVNANNKGQIQQIYKGELGQAETEVKQSVHKDAGEQGNAQMFAEVKTSVAQVRREKKVLPCPKCSLLLNKKNLKKHMERQHSVTKCRVMVPYDLEKNTWQCSSVMSKRSCITKWRIFPEHPQILKRVTSTEADVSTPYTVFEEEKSYPPEGDDLKKMVEYIFQHKQLPAILPEILRKQLSDYQNVYIPDEMVCAICPGTVPLSGPKLVTSKAMIVTFDGIVEGVSTFVKQCDQCGLTYRYQEYTHGLHNFNDYMLLGLHFCLFLRAQLQTNQAVDSAVKSLELLNDTKYPPADTILQGYIHFEALTSHQYDFSCVSCGDHPSVVIMDLYKKGVFDLAVGDLKSPPDDYKGEVNILDFWNNISKEIIARGFLPSNVDNPYVIPPSYDFWAPWIGANTRRSDLVLNTEYLKASSSRASEDGTDLNVTEDHLFNELMNQTVDDVRNLCKTCGVDSTGSRMDLLLRLRDEMQTRSSFEKIFQKIWGASGGWAAVMCPCGVVYSIKSLLRAESPRDYTDLLLAWQHLPNIAVYDFPEGFAKHMNFRVPHTMPFQPHEGRLLEPTNVNIKEALEGNVKVSLPWLAERKNPPDDNCHPFTGSAEHYALSDKFHEKNSKDPSDSLRRVGLVPELAGCLNTQVVEQFFSQMRENNYFLNVSQPSTHVFLLRNILHHQNIQRNKLTMETLQKAYFM